MTIGSISISSDKTSGKSTDKFTITAIAKDAAGQLVQDGSRVNLWISEDGGATWDFSGGASLNPGSFGVALWTVSGYTRSLKLKVNTSISNPDAKPVSNTVSLTITDQVAQPFAFGDLAITAFGTQNVQKTSAEAPVTVKNNTSKSGSIKISVQVFDPSGSASDAFTDSVSISANGQVTKTYTLNGLAPGTKYQVKFFVDDSSGTKPLAVTQTSSFTTLPDAKLNGKITLDPANISQGDRIKVTINCTGFSSEASLNISINGVFRDIMFCNKSGAVSFYYGWWANHPEYETEQLVEGKYVIAAEDVASGAKASATLTVGPVDGGTTTPNGALILGSNTLPDVKVNTDVIVSGTYTENNVGKIGKTITCKLIKKELLGNETLLATKTATTLNSGSFQVNFTGGLKDPGDYLVRTSCSAPQGTLSADQTFKVVAGDSSGGDTVGIFVDVMGPAFENRTLHIEGHVTEGVGAEGTYQLHVKAYSTNLTAMYSVDTRVTPEDKKFVAELGIPSLGGVVGQIASVLEIFADRDSDSVAIGRLTKNFAVRPQPVPLKFGNVDIQPHQVPGHVGDRFNISIDYGAFLEGGAPANAYILTEIFQPSTSAWEKLEEYVSPDEVQGGLQFNKHHDVPGNLKTELSPGQALQFRVSIGSYDKQTKFVIGIDDTKTLSLQIGDKTIGQYLDQYKWYFVGGGAAVTAAVVGKKVLSNGGLGRISKLFELQALKNLASK